MKVKEFGAVSRVSFKQQTKSGDVFYTLEFNETWTLDETDTNLDELKAKLWDTVHEQVNQQVIGIKNMYKNPQ